MHRYQQYPSSHRPNTYSQDSSDETQENSEEIKLEGNPICKETLDSLLGDYVSVNANII